MLSTLPLFYIAQSVNSDDRRARFQGLRVIMTTTNSASVRYKSKGCIAQKQNEALAYSGTF